MGGGMGGASKAGGDGVGGGERRTHGAGLGINMFLRWA